MHPVITALARHAAARPMHVALSDATSELTYGAAYSAVIETAVAMRALATHTVAVALDNAPAWLVIDLATLAGRLRSVPVPGFFSPTQQLHLIADAGVDLLITDQPALYGDVLNSNGIVAEHGPQIEIAGSSFAQFRLRQSGDARLPENTSKITYTSGTTGTPKGVCLDGEALARVARSLAAAIPLAPGDRHLCLLTLATLLENVGAYATLLAGGTCIVPPLAAVGMRGATGFDSERALAQLTAYRATTAIATPQILAGLVDACTTSRARPAALRFLAVGGARVPPALLDRAAAVGLPAYQGYGLSECTSVVALNTPRANRRASVGRALPHASVTASPEGEILVSGATLLSYCGETSAPDPWPTGDIGYLEDGYLYLTGRKRTIFITSYGRNVSPEWVEAELTAAGAIAQAWVYGEARPWNTAVITPAPGQKRAEVLAAISDVNRTLPDYARIGAWIASDQPFSLASGELTANGRLRRDALLARYRAQLDRVYLESPHHVL